jgi:hypothetical protein
MAKENLREDFLFFDLKISSYSSYSLLEKTSIFEPFGMYCPLTHYTSDPPDEKKAHSALMPSRRTYPP